MKLHTGIDEKDAKAICSHLNPLLADESVLYAKTRNFHWNVVGVQFNDLHKFFEGQYTELAEIADEVAERVRKVGGKSIGSLSEFLKYTRLKEKANHHPKALDMVKELLEDHESIIRSIREDIPRAQKHHDESTANFLTDLLEKHEKMAWMLRSFLE